MSDSPRSESPLCNGQRSIAGISLLCALLVVCVSCIENTAPTLDPALLAARRAQFILAEEPAGALSVLKVRELITGGDDEAKAAPKEVIVVGKIGGMPNPWSDTEPDFPFKKDSATLFLIDSATTEKFDVVGHGHEEHVDCPFCARAAAENIDAIAVVNFVDETGQVAPTSAQQMLELSDLATVVVRGKARLVGGKMLVIDSDGVYVRQ